MSTEHDIWGLWPEGYDRVLLEEVDSTMSEAQRRAPVCPTWICADVQTAGRGRQGKTWQAPRGNLMATLFYRPLVTPQQAALRSFMAANALFEALALYVDRTRLQQKWPNDVLLDGGKVAGILLESSGQGARLDWLAIGIGVNLAFAPDLDQPFTPVALGRIDPHRLLTEIALNFATEEAVMADLGFDPIRRAWLRHAARLGEVITARTGGEQLQGIFEGIDEQGALILSTPGGRKTLPAAEVYF